MPINSRTCREPRIRQGLKTHSPKGEDAKPLPQCGGGAECVAQGGRERVEETKSHVSH